MAGPIVHYFYDTAAVGANDGTTPTDAWASDSDILAGKPSLVAWPDIDVIVWVRRGTVWNSPLKQADDYRPGVARRIVARWPMPTDPLYAYRPGSGTAAGWDADADVRPSFGTAGWGVGDNHFLPAIEVHGLELKGYGDEHVWAYGPCRFWNCVFDPGYSGVLSRFIRLYGWGFNDQSTDQVSFTDCIFYPYNPPGAVSGPSPTGTRGETLLAISSDIQYASIQFVNCTINPMWLNLTYDDGAGAYGGLILAMDTTSYNYIKDLTFIGCTFPNQVIPLRRSDSWWTGTPTLTVSRENVRFIGCNFSGGSIVFEHEVPNETVMTEVHSDTTIYPNRDSRWANESIEKYHCVNDGKNPGKNFVCDTAVFTLFDDTAITTPGGSTALVLTPKEHVIRRLNPSPRLGTESRMFWSPLQVWPADGEYRTWFYEVPNTAAFTVKVNAMCRGWTTLPTDKDFYFVSYQLTATGATPAAKVLLSAGQFAANDVWTEFTLSGTGASAFDTYCPIFFVIKNWESGADIVIDPTLEVV